MNDGMKHCIGLVVKEDPRARKKAEEIEHYLGKRCKIIDKNRPEWADWLNDIFCIVVLGGDGTFLSAARFVGERDIPLLGVKFGEVGFLAETLENKLMDAIHALLNGKFSIEKRVRLSVAIMRNGREKRSAEVLNDVVINKSALSRLAACKVYINSSYLTTYRADGLIVATPTGSTAYSLAAGGPVIHPAVPGIILTPICPFTLTNRPLIIPDTDDIEIRLLDNPTDIVLTFDGQEGVKVDSADRIHVKKSQTPLKMISLDEENYFNVLKARLMWSGGKHHGG